MKAIKMLVLHVTLAKIQKFSSYSVVEFVKKQILQYITGRNAYRTKSHNIYYLIKLHLQLTFVQQTLGIHLDPNVPPINGDEKYARYSGHYYSNTVVHCSVDKSCLTLQDPRVLKHTRLPYPSSFPWSLYKFMSTE